ncbi:MAG TPA: glycosyltransferase [Bacteroidales bacterium]|nr:glycosyltransferase [Deltaproteobacteria bacterium]HOZ18758.1 glycosyltransferase [Candidatus Fermentibacter daniensis]HPO41289.1 glycosyltransferase [Bacteroidales bacterium]
MKTSTERVARENNQAIVDRKRKKLYVPVKVKFFLALSFSFLWVAVSAYLAIPWYKDLSEHLFHPLPEIIILGLALIPGWAMSFMVFSLILDRRPQYANLPFEAPALTLLCAAYNEEKTITDTLTSVLLQKYPAHLRVVVIDDGSRDRTAEKVREFIAQHQGKEKTFELIQHLKNQGKAAALRTGLKTVTTEYVITIDADSYLNDHAVENLVRNIVLGPKNTAAIAGNVLVRNSRENLITKLQEWDYFHGIAVIKRVQSLYQGTLVAQGAFSIYRTDAVRRLGGWPPKIGEDIVLTWGLRNHGYRIGYAENAFCFTKVPETYKQFFRQRKRWARGLIEAFKSYPSSLTLLKMSSPFIWYNLFFPLVDGAYLVFFLPGVIAAVFFHYYLIVGMMTVLLLPLAILANSLFFWHQSRIFKANGLKVRRNLLGLIVYLFAYQAIMAPATMAGYMSEMMNLTKRWGTK